MKIGAHFLPEDFTVFIESREGGRRRRLRPRLARRLPDAVGGRLGLHDACARRDRAHPAGRGCSEPVTRHYSRERERGSDAGTAPSGSRRCWAWAAATVPCERSGASRWRRRRWRRGHSAHASAALGRGDRHEHRNADPAPLGHGEHVPIAHGGDRAAQPPARRRRWQTSPCSQVGFNPASVHWAVEQVRARRERGRARSGRDRDRDHRRDVGLRRPRRAREQEPLGRRVCGEPRRRRHAARGRTTACLTSSRGSSMPARGRTTTTRATWTRPAEHTGWLTDELIDDFAITGAAEQLPGAHPGAGRSRRSTRSRPPISTGRRDQMQARGRDRSFLRWPSHRRMKRIGVDVGGDVHRPRSSSTRSRAAITVDKVPSTPDDPARGVVDGVPRALSQKAGCALDESRQPPPRHDGRDEHRPHAPGRRGRDDHDRRAFATSSTSPGTRSPTTSRCSRSCRGSRVRS